MHDPSDAKLVYNVQGTGVCFDGDVQHVENSKGTFLFFVKRNKRKTV